jgi:Na+-transporting NADH:ubiquinone oxidoreductase subunit C
VVNVNSNIFTIGFAALSCVISGALLAASNLGLKDLQDLNVKIDKQRSVLMSAGLLGQSASPDEIASWFEGDTPAMKNYIIDTATGKKDDTLSVETFSKKSELYRSKGKELVFECVKKGSECLVLPIKGQGLWGPLWGYLALDANGNDVLGVVFYDHQETPGLGAEITADWWTVQFEKDAGKKLLSKVGDYGKDSFRGISVLKGKSVEDIPAADQPYYVDGISGATITSTGVTKVLTQDLLDIYAEFLSQRRS